MFEVNPVHWVGLHGTDSDDPLALGWHHLALTQMAPSHGSSLVRIIDKAAEVPAHHKAEH